MPDEQDVVGAVAALWRYPVKSMAGQRLQEVGVTERGLRGDRAYALVDREDQKVATAKNPRKWPRLFEYAAALPDDDGSTVPPVLIMTPEGDEVSSADPSADESLRGSLGRDVEIRMVDGAGSASSEEYWPDLAGLDHRDTVTDFDLPAGTFFDSAGVHVLTTATLARMSQLHPAGEMDPRRFRPNVVVDSGEHVGFVENDWVGRTLRLGDEVRLAVTEPCPRCVMVTLPQGDLPKDTGILRTAAQHNDVHVGVYAAVVSGGRLRTGDRVTIE